MSIMSFIPSFFWSNLLLEDNILQYVPSFGICSIWCLSNLFECFGNLDIVVITQITKLPIIHIKNHIIITKTRDKDSRLNNSLILHNNTCGFIQTSNQTQFVSCSTAYIYDYKIVTNNYLSVQSTDAAYEGQPNLQLVG